MKSMEFKTFVRKLRACNPKLVVKPGPGKTASIHEVTRHEYADDRGLHHLINMPNPRKFLTLPPHSFNERIGVKIKKVLENGHLVFKEIPQEEFHRGWIETVAILIQHGHVRRSDAVRQFGFTDWHERKHA